MSPRCSRAAPLCAVFALLRPLMTLAQVPWTSALRTFLQAVAGSGARWLLVGSAASALQGVDVQPGDVDVLARSPLDVDRIARSLLPFAVPTGTGTLPTDFLSARDQPVLCFDGGRWTLGRWRVRGVTVEVACIQNPGAEHRLLETTGNPVWQRCRRVIWDGHELAVVPLEVQLATLISRRYDGRIEGVARALVRRGFDRDLLAQAIRDRHLDSADLLRYSQVSALFAR